ncbi:MAG: SGNH/GDSL hydrolase family protein, partial [Acidobacteriota bacterium]
MTPAEKSGPQRTPASEGPDGSATGAGSAAEKATEDPGGRLRPLAMNLAVAALTVVLFAAVLEVGLRTSGFSFVLYPEDIEFGKPDPVLLKNAFDEDADLFWVPKDYGLRLERLAAERPPLLLLGDSCTHFGTYGEALVKIARERRGGSLGIGNLGVAGWSSYQGRRLVEREVTALAPAVATIYFGWNDHWIGFGIEDKTIARLKGVFGSRWSRSRLVQLVMKGLVAWGARSTAYPNRVSESDFADNLTRMVADLRKAGAVPMLLTAASNHRRGEEPSGLTRRWLRNLEDLIPL